MRKLADGWYLTSDQGPMARHVPGFVVEVDWDPRMEALQPRERPEAQGASRSEDVQRWTSHDAGKSYVEIHGGRVAHVQYSGTGHVLGSKVRHAAEVLLHQWLEIPEEYLHRPAPNGLSIACWPSEVQPTHLFVWKPTPVTPPPGGKLITSVMPLRIEGDRAYGHVEWVHRAHPKCYPNWVLEHGKWWWRDPTGRLYPNPANANGLLRILPLI